MPDQNSVAVDKRAYFLYKHYASIVLHVSLCLPCSWHLTPVLLSCLNFFKHRYTVFPYSGASYIHWNMKCPNILSSPKPTVAFSGSVSVVFGPNIERCLLILQANSDTCIFWGEILEWRKENWILEWRKQRERMGKHNYSLFYTSCSIVWNKALFYSCFSISVYYYHKYVIYLYLVSWVICEWRISLG